MTTQIVKRIRHWQNDTCHSVIGWRIQEIVKNLTIWHYEEFFFHIVFFKKVGPTSNITGWILKSNLMRLHTVHYTIRTKCKMKLWLQSKFFETFAAPFTKRGLLLKFLILGGGSTLAYFSSTATGDILPIVKGPQEKPKLGPRGKI